MRVETFTRRVGAELQPYMRRVHLWNRGGDPKNGGLYLHQFLRDDPVEAPHNHPWWFLSLTLWGGYTEEVLTAAGSETRRGWFLKLVFRRPGFTHRIVAARPGTWTLILTGPKVRDWEFLTPAGAVEGYTYLRNLKHEEQ